MKSFIKLICFIFLLIISYSLNAQQIKAYNESFKYIRTLYKKQKLTVNPNVYHIDLSDFFVEISSEWSMSQDATLKILDSIDNENPFIEITCDYLKKINTKGSYQPKAVYFSTIYKKLLTIEVFEGNADKSYFKQTTFNSGLKYLFVFDDKGYIKKVFSKKIFYN